MVMGGKAMAEMALKMDNPENAIFLNNVLLFAVVAILITLIVWSFIKRAVEKSEENVPLATKTKRKNGKKLLLTISWIIALLPYLCGPIVLGLSAFLLGLVLERDFEAGNQGKIIMVLGAANIVGGTIIVG